MWTDVLWQTYFDWYRTFFGKHHRILFTYIHLIRCIRVNITCSTRVNFICSTYKADDGKVPEKGRGTCSLNLKHHNKHMFWSICVSILKTIWIKIQPLHLGVYSPMHTIGEIWATLNSLGKMNLKIQILLKIRQMHFLRETTRFSNLINVEKMVLCSASIILLFHFIDDAVHV